MNYAAHYNRLIERARHRVLEGYRERHHVVPKCIGGNNSKENLVDLTAEEHCCAHKLLARMYPSHVGLVLAAVKMTGGHRDNKSYGIWRRMLAKALIGNRFNDGRIISAETRAKISAAGIGRKQSPEAIAKTAAARRGKRHTAEAKEKMAAAARGNKWCVGRVQSTETRAKIAAGHLGKRLSQEHKEAVRAANIGKKWSPEFCAKVSAGLKGKPKSLEHRAKLSIIARNRVPSPETGAKISAALRGKKKPPRSPTHCAALSRAMLNKNAAKRSLLLGQMKQLSPLDFAQAA